MKKTLSIKDVDVENINYINSLKGEGETAADALTNLILKVQQAETTETDLLATNQSLVLQIEELSNTQPKEIEYLQTNLQALETELLHQQKLIAETSAKTFVDFEPNVLDALVTLRRFLKQKNKIPTESTEQEFLNRFVNGALLDFINDKYDFIKL